MEEVSGRRWRLLSFDARTGLIEDAHAERYNAHDPLSVLRAARNADPGDLQFWIEGGGLVIDRPELPETVLTKMEWWRLLKPGQRVKQSCGCLLRLTEISQRSRPNPPQISGVTLEPCPGGRSGETASWSSPVLAYVEELVANE